MLKRVSIIIGFFVVGMVGGIFAEQIFWPYFVERPLFYQYELEKTPIYITEKKEIFIQENTALIEAVERAEKVVVGIKTITANNNILDGSGVIVTADGLIITLADLVPKGSNFNFFIDGKKSAYQILKRDLVNNLALIELEQDDLTTNAFADTSKLKIGERVFLIGKEFNGSVVEQKVNEGIISKINDELLETNITESSVFSGSPLFNIKGELLGVAVISDDGIVKAIPASMIKEFLGF